MSEDSAERVMRGVTADVDRRERDDARWRYALAWQSVTTMVFGGLTLTAALLHVDLGVTLALVVVSGALVGSTASLARR